MIQKINWAKTTCPISGPTSHLSVSLELEFIFTNQESILMQAAVMTDLNAKIPFSSSNYIICTVTENKQTNIITWKSSLHGAYELQTMQMEISIIHWRGEFFRYVDSQIQIQI